MLTDYEMSAITRAVGAMERIADALEAIRDKLPEDASSNSDSGAYGYEHDNFKQGYD